MTEFNGEALNFNASRRLHRAIDQLIGICSGIIADGVINDQEIAFVSTWLAENKAVCVEFPGKQIAERLNTVLADGKVSTDERGELLSLFKQISGNGFSDTGATNPEGAAVPADVSPEIVLAGKRFCFTGKFAFGSRGRCEAAVVDCGGEVINDITKSLDYLVLGVGVSKDWKHETYGRKIEKALQMRAAGSERPIIVAEADWVAAL